MDGGFQPGHLAIAGESRHFKSNFAIKIASDLMAVRPNAELIWFDNEFGTPEDYFKNFNVDFDRVLHAPIVSVEDLKEQMTRVLKGLEGEEEVIMIVDSVGGLASEKEINDAEKGDRKKDLTRNQELKSLFRIITPLLKIKKVWLITINHVYMTLEMFSKQVMSSGSGALLSADNQWFIGRQQVKDGAELQGFNFVIRTGKSRYIKEGSSIPITVTFEGGINKWSGLFDLAREMNYVTMPKNGWYIQTDGETGEVLTDKNVRKSEAETDEFWAPIFEKTDFKEAIANKFKLGKKDHGSEEQPTNE